MICFIKCFVYALDDEDSDVGSLSVGAVIAIVCVIVLVIAIIIFVVIGIFVKRKFFSMSQEDTTGKQLNAVVYDEEPVCILSDTSDKVDVKLKPNPVYDTSNVVVMDTNPA